MANLCQQVFLKNQWFLTGRFLTIAPFFFSSSSSSSALTGLYPIIYLKIFQMSLPLFIKGLYIIYRVVLESTAVKPPVRCDGRSPPLVYKPHEVATATLSYTSSSEIPPLSCTWSLKKVRLSGEGPPTYRPLWGVPPGIRACLPSGQNITLGVKILGRKCCLGNDIFWTFLCSRVRTINHRPPAASHNS